MDEFIRRKSVEDAVRDHWCDSSRTMEAITRIPAADVAPVVHGMWKSEATREPFLKMQYKCSKCGYLVDRVSNFCPNCGAKMDGGAHETD